MTDSFSGPCPQCQSTGCPDCRMTGRQTTSLVTVNGGVAVCHGSRALTDEDRVAVQTQLQGCLDRLEAA